MKIGIINGSIRDGRAGAGVGEFVKEIADARGGDVNYELIDLKSFNLPLFTGDTLPMMMNKQYDTPEATAWSQAIDACDAYVVITPEYNHSVPGALKNAFDSLGTEWVGKVVGFVGYGAVGGVRAIEHWRTIVANFSMHDVRAEVNLNLFVDWNDERFAPTDRRADEVNAVFDAVEELAAKLA